MDQINTCLPESAPLIHRLDPIGALVGYATVGGEIADKRLAAPPRPELSRMMSASSCRFQSSPPTSKAVALTAELADARRERITAPCPQGQSGSWLTRLWSRYVAWREYRRAAAVRDMLDRRTLRDLGALSGEIDDDAQSAGYSEWYTVL